MRFETLSSFDGDFRRLSHAHRTLFLDVVRNKFAPACDAFAHDSAFVWPAALRVKPVQGAKGIFEMTWSFAGPDGRATFEFVSVDRELYCRWRRIGDHKVFSSP